MCLCFSWSPSERHDLRSCVCKYYVCNDMYGMDYFFITYKEYRLQEISLTCGHVSIVGCKQIGKSRESSNYEEHFNHALEVIP